MGAVTGWITQLTNWLDEKYSQAITWAEETLDTVLTFVDELYDAGVDMFREAMHELVLAWVDGALELIKTALFALPAPEFLEGVSLNDVFMQGGPWVQFIVGQLQLAQCLAVIGAAYIFRMLRKFFTLGMW